MIQTSSFTNGWHHPKAVAVCRFPPPNWRGRVYEPLAPPAWALKIKDAERFGRVYTAQLQAPNAREVYEELGADAVLLCYEREGEFCHRRIVAAWLEAELGIEIPELRVPRTMDLFELQKG